MVALPLLTLTTSQPPHALYLCVPNVGRDSGKELPTQVTASHGLGQGR